MFLRNAGDYMKKIMIIEDDETISKELNDLLKNAGYETKILENFNNSKNEILDYSADLLLLDINIPVVNGEVLLKEIRKESNVPVIMVTSRLSEIDEALSISYGADDYITKPYNPTILLLRISNIFKRCESVKEIIEYRNLKINLKKGIVSNGKEEIILTKNETIIFNYLLSNKDRIVTRDEIMTDLWNNDEYINDNALTVNISRLRSKLSKLDSDEIIETRKGIGYILV